MWMNHTPKIYHIKVKGVTYSFSQNRYTFSVDVQYLAPYGYLVVKRATICDDMFIVGESIIDDVSILLANENDEFPEAYEAISPLDLLPSKMSSKI